MKRTRITMKTVALILASVITLLMLFIAACTSQNQETPIPTGTPTPLPTTTPAPSIDRPAPSTPPASTSPGQSAVAAAPAGWNRLAIGESPGSQPASEEVVVAGSDNETQALAGILSNQSDISAVESADLKDYLVVGLFRGVTNTSGYGITLQELKFATGEVTLVVGLSNPSKGSETVPATFTSYDIGKISRSQLTLNSDGSINFIMTDNAGNKLAQTKYTP
ncbi:MAG: hypothetical protein PHU08_05505 [Dehalococcoidales bacterium]|nr:hypothetical protein [Dehalococcoidales bacterium]